MKQNETAHSGHKPLLRMLAIAFVLLLAAGAGWLIWYMSGDKDTPALSAEEIRQISVTPTAESELGLALDSALKIEAPAGVTARQLRQSIRLSPQTEYRLDRQADGKYILVPKQQFEPGKLVNLRFVGFEGEAPVKSWAFQTEAPFRITEALPADGSEYVNIATGIEVTFSSAQVSREDFAAALHITPEVAGHVEQYASTLVFVPDEPLTPNTVYTVTVSGELAVGEKKLGEDYTFGFRTWNFNGSDREVYRFENAAPVSESFLPDDVPVVELYASSRAFNASPVSVTVYSYGTPGRYRQALEEYAKLRNEPMGALRVPEFSSEGLQQVLQFETTVVYPERNQWGSSYVVLPQTLPEGYYLAELSVADPAGAGELKVQKLLQVSPLSVYHVQVEDDLVLWANDTDTGKPVAAQLEIAGDAFSLQGETGTDGVYSTSVALPEGEQRRNSVLCLTVGQRQYLDLITKTTSVPETARDRWYSYLYIDRSVYLSSDTIHFWGVVAPRKKGAGLPDELTVNLGGYQDALYTVPVQVDADGTFSGELSFEKLGARDGRSMRIGLRQGEEELSSCYLSVYNYVKPIYQNAFSSSRPVYQNPLSEPLDLTFTSKFFDGTPANNVRIRMECDGVDAVSRATDENGAATWSFTLRQDNTSSHPDWVWVSVSSDQPENEYFYSSYQLPVFYRDVVLRGKAVVEEGAASVEVSANRLDLSGIGSAEELTEERYTGAPYEGTVSAELRRVYYLKTETGSYYDFIRKQRVPTYEYDRREETVLRDAAVLQDGRCTFENLPVNEPESCYYLVLRIRDASGREVEETVWVGNRYSPWYYGSTQYRFARADDPERYVFTDEETVELQLVSNRANRRPEGGQALCAVAQDGLREVQTGGLAFSLPYREEHLPNLVVTGAYFDGRYVYAADPLYLSYDPKLRELELKVSADRAQYAHGDEAQVEVTVTDPQSGKPVKNVPVLLSVVDEAVFAIAEQQAAPLASFYQSLYSPDIRSYTSYIFHDLEGSMAGEKGGGGGDSEMRTDFRDTPAFLTGRTDRDGKANFTFTLPDSLTSWRLTALAVKDGRYLGAGREQIVTTGSFFLSPVAPSTLLVGDDVAISLRSYGSGINADTPVEYTVTVLQDEAAQRRCAQNGRAGEFTTLRLESLPVGEYTLRIEAQAGSLYDGVETPLLVRESAIEVTLSKTLELGQGLELEAERYPVTLGLYNQEYAFYSRILEETATAFGARADQRAAAAWAAEQMNPQAKQEREKSEKMPLDGLINDGGLVSLLPYSANDCVLSALLHVAVPEYLNGGDQTGGFYRYLLDTNSTASEIAAAYLGLAAHQEPVLLDVQYLLAHPEGLSENDQLYLTAALALLGDYDGAIAAYGRLITPMLVFSRNSAGEELACHGISGNSEEILARTAAASIPASILGTADAEPMLRYLSEHPSKTDPYLLERIIYLRWFLPENGEDAVVSLQLNGEEQTIALEPCRVHFLQLSKEQLEQSGLRTVSGKVGVKAFYTAQAEEGQARENQNIVVTKRLEAADGGKIGVNSLVRVRLTVRLPLDFDGATLWIDDYLPSGMRYIGQGRFSMTRWCAQPHEGQHVAFSQVGYFDDYDYSSGEMDRYFEYPGIGQRKFETELVYYARCVTPGVYVNESAYAACPENGVWGMSDRGTVLIDG